MRNKIGNGCILLGAVLLCCALLLFGRNQAEAAQAGEEAETILPQLLEILPKEPQTDSIDERYIPLEFRDPASFEMAEVTINGYGYIGTLVIPTLELELPIMADWDYKRLQIAPCRYTGSVLGEDLVLMAHNYSTHFGRLSSLSEGDAVLFTDVQGVTTMYEVVAQDVLLPVAVEEMTAGNYDLTLFTCTYGGKSRITVYCDIKKD